MKVKGRAISFCTIVIAAGLVHFLVQAQTQKNENDNLSFYQERELSAKPEIKSMLQSLREKIKTKSLTFQVGYTLAMDYQIEQITGLIVPPDLDEQIGKQNAQVQQLMGKQALTAIGTCTTSTGSYDWRAHNGTTPVRNQMACGSCWDFASVGAFEGNYRLKNNIAIDCSEQQILDCNPQGYNCVGGWWIHQYLIDTGVTNETTYPYTGVKGTCNNSFTKQYKAASWGYIGGSASVPSVASIKQGLCEHGPLSIAVLVTPLFQAYTNGVFNETAGAWTASTNHSYGDLVKPANGNIYACIAAGKTGTTQPAWPTSGTVTDGTVTWKYLGVVNHGVTLIGWNDSLNAWLIKNSWGTAWGQTCGSGTEKGYMWINYSTDNVGFGAAWVEAKKSTGCCK